MHRLLIAALVAVVMATATSNGWSKELAPFPAHPQVSPDTITKFPLGPGYYLSWIKILAAWLVFLLWVRSVDWMSRDGFQLRLDYRRWNMAAFFSFIGAFILLWVLPWLWLAFPLLLLAWLVPFIAYVVHRNGKVAIGETVFTRDHIRFWLSEHLRVVGIKIAAESRSRGKVPPVELEARGGADERANAANLLLARQSMGYPLVQELFAEMATRRADAALMDFTQASVAMRYQIDGVWHDAEPREREPGDAMLAVVKTLAGRDAKQRVARQEGSYGAEFKKIKYNCRLISQGTKTGERVILQVSPAKKKSIRLADLDIRGKLLEDFKAVLDVPRGLIVVSTPPAGGLSTLLAATVGSMDRFTRSFVAVESLAAKELDVENVVVTTFNSAAGETPTTVLPKLVREHPDVFVVPDMVDADGATALCEQVETENRMVVTTTRAKEAAESLLRILMLKVAAAKFAPVVTAVLNERLIRKLCPKCKEGYAPPPQVLQQLGIPAGRVEAFYRPPQEPEEVCPECQGIGYLGRTGIFELLIVDDNMRQALTTTPQLAAVRQAARKAGMRSLQEEGIVLVAKGITSLPELMRVLKE
ncbi:MAG: Flp pilus assembly complex ATPase component TadA [Planctomycetia bacterium]|nr:Flp pilus assembly complex ATPase component TadA [Planctomycetia bacterium]